MEPVKTGYLLPVKEDIEQEIKQGKHVYLHDIADSAEREGSLSPRDSAYSVLSYVRSRLAHVGIPVVRLPGGAYGIPNTHEEVSYAMEHYVASAHRLALNALVLKKYATINKILPSGFKEARIALPNFSQE